MKSLLETSIPRCEAPPGQQNNLFVFLCACKRNVALFEHVVNNRQSSTKIWRFGGSVIVVAVASTGYTSSWLRFPDNNFEEPNRAADVNRQPPRSSIFTVRRPHKSSSILARRFTIRQMLLSRMLLSETGSEAELQCLILHTGRILGSSRFEKF